MKKIMLSVCLNAGLLLLACTVSAQNVEVSKKYTFVNNAGEDANDLHIEFNKEVELVNSSEGIAKKFGKKKSEKANNKTTLHFENKGEGKDGSQLVKNDADISGEFISENGDFKIERWWWTRDGRTIGNVQNGDADKTRQSPMLIVPSEDVVTEFDFENDIYKGRKGKKEGYEAEEAVVNDLHIVTKKPVQPINSKKKDSNDPAKVGGVFGRTETIKCACDQLPDNERNTETNVRKTARLRMPEPCRTICETCKEERYVTHLSNPAANLPRGTKVPIQLRGDEKTEIEEWWWTQDGKPLHFQETTDSKGDKEGKVRTGTNGAPYKPSSDWDKGGKASDGAEMYFVALSDQNPLGNMLTLGSGYTFQPDNVLETVLPRSASQQIYQDEQLFEQLFEQLGREFFIGEVTDYTFSSRPDVAIEGGLSFGKWQLRLRGMTSGGQVSGIFPIVALSSSRENMLEGKISTRWQNYSGSIGVRKYFGDGNLLPFAESGFIASTIRSKELKVQIENQSEFTLPNALNQNYIGGYLRTGVYRSLGKRVFVEISAELEARMGEKQSAILLPRGNIAIGLNLGTR
ncbi:MAG: hypothetical protein IPJ74_03225 [Saprospiraceae bacterium]|nr:hypothetical protein [Saprospiraceae bacterium]